MNYRTTTVAILGALLSISFCCKGTGKDSLKAAFERLRGISPEKWEALAQKKIFFGHKSVGYNIIEGLEEVMAEFPSARLNVRETTEPRDFAGPVFAHAPVGTNMQPLTKIDRFREIMDGGVGQAADIAFFKFCYVDIDHSTDVEALFNSYVELILGLQERFPRLRIVTFTAPLMSKPLGVRTRLKQLLGRLPWYDEANVKRNLFNALLRARFGGSLFDLAAFESRIDGTKKATFRKNGNEYEMLNRAYTDDSGHLNSTGRQVIASELLRFLADL